MKEKYRLKLSNGRVVGPFVLIQIGQLYAKGHIKGPEFCQLFPDGGWKPIGEFREISQLILDIIEKKVSIDELSALQEAETLQKIILPEKKRVTPKGPAEFKITKKNYDESIDYEALEKKYGRNETKKINKLKGKKEKKEEEDIEKTVINTEFEKIPIEKNQTNDIKMPEELKKENEIEEKNKQQREQRKEQEKKELLESKTQMINTKTFWEELVQEKEEGKKEKGKKSFINKIIPSSFIPSSPQKKRRSKIVLILIVLLFIILLSEEDDDKKVIRPSYISINFPVAKEYKDVERSNIFLERGLKEYVKGNYLSKSKAASHFKNAVEFDEDNKKAMGYLILSYAELFDGAQDKKNAGNTIFQLIRISKNRLLSDINIALGSAIFYMKIKKIPAARRILENYLRVGKPSLKFTAFYLLVLLEQGKFEKAKDVVKRMKQKTKLPVVAWLALAKYHETNQEFTQGKELLEQAWKMHENSVPILLAYAKYVLDDQDFKKLTLLLLAVEKLKAEKHPVYYAKYLEYMGILMAKNKKNTAAATFFKYALAINKSDELLFKLSALDLEGDAAVKKLILVSKIIRLMQEAKSERKKRNSDYAFHLAIKAADLSKDFLPAQLLLAEMKIEQGHFDLALKSLENLYKNNPLNPRVSFLLLQAYINSYKLDKAKQHFITISNLREIKGTVEYASAFAKYYLATKNIKQAIRWLRETINRDPLNDESYFLLAKTLLKYRKFKKSKLMLGKAIDLDPENVYYRAEYAKILYELENVETAIGYLREQLKNHPSDPKLLGDVAIYYYRSGQIKYFEKYKKQIEGLSKKDVHFYNFLVQSANIEGDSKKMIQYSKQLIKIRPGDLETRMFLAKHYFNMNDLKNATIEFEKIKKWLPSYPRINFFLSKMHIQKKDYKTALELGEMEIELNPTLAEGHYIVGELYKIEGKYSKATRKFQTAISFNQQFADAFISLAWIKHKQNRFNEAREFYEKALKIDRGNANVIRELGHVYRDIGQGILAKKFYNDYLKLFPKAKDSAYIKNIVNQLD